MNRLTRLDQVFTEQLFYFITFCARERAQILADPSIHQCFCQFGEEASRRQIFVGRYVIMPDHIHLVVALPEQAQLSLWMKSLKNTLSKALRSIGISAPHWQKGYFDHLMRDEASYDSKWEYVRANPVRQNLVTDSALWPYQGEINPLSFN